LYTSIPHDKLKSQIAGLLNRVSMIKLEDSLESEEIPLIGVFLVDGIKMNS
jgi:hypothetical protein